MEKRTCPKCNAHLGDHDGYYCSACGEKLPKDLIRASKAIRIRTYSPSEPEVAKGPGRAKLIRKLKNKTFWIVFGLVVFIFAVLVGIGNSGVIELILSKVSSNLNTPSINLPIGKNTPVSPMLDLSIPISPGEFGTFELESHVPAEVDFYFESSSLSELLDRPLFDFADENFTPKARILLNDNFVGFAYDVEEVNRWGFIFVPKDMQIAQEVFGNGWEDYWKIAFTNDYMILANNEDVFDLVKSVDGGLNLSLAQNPDFVKKVRNLDSVGQVKIVFMTNQASGIVRESLGGFTQDTIGMINKVLTSGYDGLVVAKENGQN